MSEEILDKILEQHTVWVESDGDEGNRASFSGADLHSFNLSGTDLRYADFFGANLSGANLIGADLRGADLRGANLFKARIYGANLRGADLRGANLFKARISGANLRGADLRGANLFKARISGVNLFEADFCGATNVPFIPMTCPDSGSFIGWKKASGRIVKLLIPEDARRSSSTGRKCRSDKAVVLAIETINGRTSKLKEVCSSYDSDFIYRIGETVTVDNFDEDRFNECASGIHFFINRQEAVEY